MGDIHWQLAKNGQEPARLATPDGSFSLPYDATIPCRAKVGMPGGFSGSCGFIPFTAVNGGSAAAGLGNPRKGRPAGGGRPNGTVRVDLAFTDRSIRQVSKSRI